MVSGPLVSVIIPFLNAERFLEEAVRSVLAQSYRRWELLLVDDGSDDRSPQIAGACVERDPGKIRYLHHPERRNRGLSASRNLGIRQASGEYIAFLDADDVWLPLKLERQLAILASHSEAAMVYGKTEYWYSWTGEPSDARRDRVQEHWVAGDVLFQPPALLASFLSGQAAVPPPSSVLVQRDAIRRIGGFEECFTNLYEDQAFYAKVCLEYPVFVSNECLDRYRQHPDSICALASGLQQAALRKRFLEWLRDYLASRGVADGALWEALCRQSWLARQTRLGASSERFQSLVRWMKKWRLGAEDLFLPISLRRRLWLGDARRLDENKPSRSDQFGS